jgi:hypothetical protein
MDNSIWHPVKGKTMGTKHISSSRG